VEVTYWVYPQDVERAEPSFRRAAEMVDYFTDLIGPFPFEKLANVQSATRFGGMENASAIFYSEQGIASGRNMEGTVSHEIAHQWFGDAVTESDWHHLWLSEGFATYFTMLFVEHAYGRDEMVKLLERSRDYIFEFAEKNPDYTIVHDNLDDMSKVLTGNIYQKGAWTLHMLRELIGDDAFWTGIRDYYARHQNGSATTDDFVRAMEEASGRELDSFFDLWLHRGGAVELEASWTWDDTRSLLTLTVDQVQPNGLPYDMPLEVAFSDTAGDVRIVTVELSGLNHQFDVELDQEPTSVTLDPSLKLLSRWELQRN
jgi:aminopeptidase N